MRKCPQCGRNTLDDAFGGRPGEERRVVCKMCGKRGYWAPIKQDPRPTRRIRVPPPTGKEAPPSNGKK